VKLPSSTPGTSRLRISISVRIPKSLTHTIKRGHTRQENLWINIQVAQLDQLKISLTHKGKQSLNFTLTVDQAGIGEQIDRSV